MNSHLDNFHSFLIYLCNSTLQLSINNCIRSTKTTDLSFPRLQNNIALLISQEKLVHSQEYGVLRVVSLRCPGRFILGQRTTAQFKSTHTLWRIFETVSAFSSLMITIFFFIINTPTHSSSQEGGDEHSSIASRGCVESSYLLCYISLERDKLPPATTWKIAFVRVSCLQPDLARRGDEHFQNLHSFTSKYRQFTAFDRVVLSWSLHLLKRGSSVLNEPLSQTIPRVASN